LAWLLWLARGRFIHAGGPEERGNRDSDRGSYRLKAWKERQGLSRSVAAELTRE
jgi:hypothetical protein